MLKSFVNNISSKYFSILLIKSLYKLPVDLYLKTTFSSFIKLFVKNFKNGEIFFSPIS